MSNPVNPMTVIAATPMTQQKCSSSNNSGSSSWFEAMAQAWGQALDNQATRIQEKADVVNASGADNPSAITALSTESLKMSFLSNSSHTSIASVGEALDTMARKQ